MASELTFETPLRFRCVEGCGLCCSFRVPVLAGETTFLETYDRAVVRHQAEEAGQAPSVVGQLRRENGYCVLLDEDKRCSIYADRPIYCRLFPLTRDSYGHRQIDANFSCPGLGEGEPFAARDFEAVAELEATAADLEGWERRQRESYEFAVQMLRARGAYCPEEAMRAAVGALVDEALSEEGSLDLSGCLRQAVEAARPGLTGCGNLEESAVEELAASRAESPTCKRPSPPLREAGQLPGPLSPLSGRGAARLSAEEGGLLGEYLMLWVSRSLTLRAAHAQALASPTPENVVWHFAHIVSRAAQEVCEAAEASCEANRIADAIRRVEAPLRSRYMSAGISFC